MATVRDANVFIKARQDFKTPALCGKTIKSSREIYNTMRYQESKLGRVVGKSLEVKELLGDEISVYVVTSYDVVIGVSDGDKNFVTKEKWSVTTTKHTTKVRQGFSDYREV